MREVSLSLNPTSAFVWLPLHSLMGLWPRLHEAFWGSSKLPGLKTRLSDWYGTWLEPYLSVAGWCLAHMPDSTTCLFPDCRLGWGWWGTDVKCMRAKISLVMMLRRSITQQMFMLCDRCTAYIMDCKWHVKRRGIYTNSTSSTGAGHAVLSGGCKL